MSLGCLGGRRWLHTHNSANQLGGGEEEESITNLIYSHVYIDYLNSLHDGVMLKLCFQPLKAKINALQSIFTEERRHG